MSEQSGAAEAEKPSDGEGALDALTSRYQAQTTFYKVMAGAAVFFALAIGALAGYGVYLNRHIDQRTNSINETVNRVTNPKTQTQQFQGFLNLEASIFHSDCVAKAHQLTIIDNNLHGDTTEPQLEAECARIVAPRIPPLK